MEIKNLSHLTLQQVTHAFSAAFIDYKIKLQLTEEEMAAKIKSENIQLHYSAGAFEGDLLTGFILTATDVINNKPVVYNAGTAVLPAFRGKAIAKKLYQYLIPELKNHGYYNHLLEVFDDNDKAISVYKNFGFNIKRSMVGYNGRVGSITKARFDIIEIPLDADLFQSFWDITPSWQNGLPSIKRNEAAHKIIGITDENGLIAYAIYVPANGRVKQLAVKPTERRKGLGSHLLNHIMQQIVVPQLTITCVECNEGIDKFMKKLGLTTFIDMFEMEMSLTENI